MPIGEDRGRPGGRVLTDAAGRELLRFTEARYGEQRIADAIEPVPGVGLDAIVAAVMRDLRGWRVGSDAELGSALVAAGARPLRRATLRSRDLRRDPAPPGWADPPRPPGVRIGPLDRTAPELGEAYRLAYPPGHADWAHEAPPEDPVAELAQILAGAVAGPLLACSRLATRPDGSVAGALVVTDLEGVPPTGGPWVAELFRHPAPALAGTGRALLQAGLAAATAARLESLGLIVSHGNPAERLYAELGFAPVTSVLSVRP